MASVLITGGTVTTASEQYVADVFVDDGVIVQIGANLEVAADQVVSAEGQYVIPGGIDVHTHLGETVFRTITADSWESGTVAAAFGGTTTVVDFARQEREGMSPIEAIEHRRRQAESQAVIDYGFHLMATNLSSQEYLEELAALPGEGVSSFKLLMAYPGTMMVDDLTIFRAMQVAADTGRDRHAARRERSRDPADHRSVQPSRARCRNTCTCTPIRTWLRARRRIAGSPWPRWPGRRSTSCICPAARRWWKWKRPRLAVRHVYAETCPQYLFAAYEDYENAGFEAAKYICSPPIRERANQDELWRGIETGALSVIATDHCTFRMNDDLDELAAAKADGPRRLPLHPQRRARRREPDAPDVRRRRRRRPLRHDALRRPQLHDAGQALRPLPAQRRSSVSARTPTSWSGTPTRTTRSKQQTHHMRVDYNLYEGMKVSGRPSTVISRGEIIVSGDQFLGQPGRGQYIRRSTPYVLNHPAERDGLT